MEVRRVRLASGVELDCDVAGPEEGRLVLLLHNFPECRHGWRHQLLELAAAGYRVVAPDQRGYGASSKPPGVAAYDLDVLADDVAQLADALGRRTFSVVGHDWGATIGWWVATRHAERVERLCVLNAPHPGVWKHAMRSDPVQRRQSWYVRVFRLPKLPELLMRARDHKALADALRGARRPDAFSEEDLARYRAVWREPAALAAMVNWYRALLAKDLPDPAHAPRIRVPVRILWGVHDPYAIRDLAERSRALCDDASVTYLEDATLWVQHDEPERVSELLLAALA